MYSTRWDCACSSRIVELIICTDGNKGVEYKEAIDWCRLGESRKCRRPLTSDRSTNNWPHVSKLTVSAS